MPKTGLSVTTQALTHIKKMLEKQPGAAGIRVAVKNSGCSGKSYVVRIIEASEPNDSVYKVADNVLICVDPQSLEYMNGTVIDYERKGLNGKLIFHNPQEKASCGCGESFYV